MYERMFDLSPGRFQIIELEIILFHLYVHGLRIVIISN